MSKKLIAVLMALCMIVPGIAVAAEGLGAAELGFLLMADEVNLPADSEIEADITLNGNKTVYANGSTLYGTVTVAPGSKVTISGLTVMAQGDETVPAILVGAGAELTLVDCYVIGGLATAKQLLSAAIAAESGATVTLQSSAALGGYGVKNAADTTVNVYDSFIFGTVAAMANAASATTDADHKMVEVGDYLKDVIDAGDKASKLIDLILTGRAIVSVTRLSTAVEGKVDGNVVTFTAEDLENRNPKILNYYWAPKTVTFQGKTVAFEDNFDGTYTATVTLDAPFVGKAKADVDFVLNVALSDEMNMLMAVAPVAFDKLLNKLDSYTVEDMKAAMAEVLLAAEAQLTEEQKDAILDAAKTKVLPILYTAYNRFADEIGTGLEIIDSYDPKTFVKNAWAYLVENGADKLEQLLTDPDYAAALYTKVMDAVEYAVKNAIDKYPTAKEIVIETAEKYLTEENYEKLVDYAKDNFGAAAAKYPELADKLVELLKKAASAAPALAEKADDVAQKVMNATALYGNDIREKVDTLVLDYVLPFLYGETIETITGSTVIYVEAAADDETTKPEDSEPEGSDPEETDPEETDPEETDPEETDPEETDPLPPQTGDVSLSLVALSATAVIALGATFVCTKRR